MLTVELGKALERDFIRAAKEAFPRETLAYLIGQHAGDLVLVEGLWIPDDIAKYTGIRNGRAMIEIPPHWLIDAAEHAVEEEASLLGDIHSHTYPHHDFGGVVIDPVPSECDLDNQTGLIHGICNIRQSKKGRLTARVRWWGPTPQVEVTRH